MTPIVTIDLSHDPTRMNDDILAETRRVMEATRGYIHERLAAKVAIRDTLYTGNRIFQLTGPACQGKRRDNTGGGYRIE